MADVLARQEPVGEADGVSDKSDLKVWVEDAIKDLGPSSVVDVSRWVWDKHEQDLRESGSLFYTWQYDLRWAAQVLRNEGRLAPVGRGRSAVWRFAG